MNERPQTSFLSFVIYFFVFILLVEWLKPVIELTDTDHLKLFSVFLAISFLFYFVKLNWKFTIPIKILFISWVLVAIHTDLSFFSSDSMSYLVNTLQENVKFLIFQQWQEVTDSFRTLLFFILLWMTTYLLNYWIRVRKNILLFFVLTVLFITILDTFTPYNGEKGIIVVLISGFIISGLLYAQKVMTENKVQASSKFLFSIIVSLFGLMAISGVIAYVLPKAGPSWPDPVPFLTSSNPLTEGEGSGKGGSVTRKVGYGENDEKLGGAFLSDDTPVFNATVPRKQYWKIETKDTYTSKGWIQSEGEPQITSYEVGTPIILDIPPGVEENNSSARLEMNPTFNFEFIMQPYGLTNVNAEEPVTLSLDGANQKITSYSNGNLAPLVRYDLSYSEPVYSLKALRGQTEESLNGLTSDFDRYLQLPDTLPSRVRDLAVSITENNNSLYDKAKSIERYFSRNDFRYDQMLAAIPTGDTDYVDQFLFETKIGYCDNFSTSMVVMLRSLGIPARWVKGFTAGEIIGNNNGVPVYEITNNNAHSWVEAYFPEVGWMLFEPTIGFSNSPDIDYDLDISTSEEDTPVPPSEQKPEQEENEKEKKEVSKGFTELMQDGLKWISERKALIFWSLLGFLILSLLAYQYRRKWISKVLIPVYRIRKNDWDTFEKMYHQLLKQLSSYGLDKDQGQTLTDYAKKIDTYFGGSHMKRLTQTYERGFYGDNRNEIDYTLMRESWENLINQLSG
ncbi:DUF4129 domain-containing transglutaminase family protein [Psychrobacillus sp. FJAT-21963]|uniref:DUF4129 domain-containing transglutaminase family protein n=1 Tax=Psychrobacillus sp. FJAT-21963 TaxID=1712028 RepID=UPI000700F49A|nr:transglutaminase domain-containing protein [Psychrobacillus sp. FJAT-21963]KQL35383.1 transglutaminase [Psychrobacillus sp. FJAT-21963]